MKLVICDDHLLIREGFASLFSSFNGVEEIFQCENLDALKQILSTQSDITLALVDLMMDEPTSVDVVSIVRRLSPKTKVAILSMNEEPEVICSFLDHGVQGYLPKSLSHGQLMQAFEEILAGRIYCPPGVQALRSKRVATTMTPRQAQVLKLLSEGASNKKIARTLNLSESTVKTHVSAILLALKADNRLMAVQIAAKQGLIPSTS